MADWAGFTNEQLLAELARLTAECVTLQVEALRRAMGMTGVAWAVPWDRDIVDELAFNPGPYDNWWLQRDGGWWHRTLDQIDKVTFHHTLSDSPHATAQHCIGKGIPSIEYTIWVTQTGEVLLCAPLEWGLWHDHTGHENTHLSVGLAGSLHLYAPADAQLDAAARVAAWAIGDLPNIDGVVDITGHRDWTATICPGWDSDASGRWKERLYDKIAEAIR